MTTKPRCQKVFEQSIKSDFTRKSYLFCLGKFMEFVGVKNMEELLQSDQKNIQEKVEDFVFHLKPKLNPNTIGTRLSPVFLFYDMNDVILNKTKIKKMFPAKVKKQGFNAYTRNDIHVMLENTNKKRTKCMILIFSSTGCRVGGLCDLRIGDILEMPNTECKCLRFHTGYPQEYYGFLTPEATRMLDEYLKERVDHGERLEPESPLIANYQNLDDSTRKITPVTNSDVSHAVSTIFLHLDARKRDIGGRHLIPLLHGFRKYFNKILKMRDGCNLSICEKLMGHSVTISLDNSYLPVEKEDLFPEFEKAIPELTIGEEERQKLRIKELEKEQETQEDKAKENKLLKEDVEVLKHRVEIMEKRNDCLFVRFNDDKTTFDPSEHNLDVESRRLEIHDELTYLNAMFEVSWLYDFEGDFSNFDSYKLEPKNKPVKYHLTFSGTGTLHKRENYRPDSVLKRLGEL